MTTIDSWRGVAAEQTDDLPEAATLFLRLRSRRLLGGLLRPHRAAVVWLLAVVVAENLAKLAVPVLVKVGIDSGIPPVLHGRGPAALGMVTVGMLGAVALQAGCHRAFLLLSGRIGQDVLLELRRRVFDHLQRLSVSFHERYTSGRVISRLTSDIDTIATLLENGVEDLISSLLLVVGTGVLLLVLDWQLGLVTLVAFPLLAWLARWFRRESARAYRRTREAVALLIVHFVESMRGIRAVQAFSREPRNQAIFQTLNQRYRLANRTSFRLVAVFSPSVVLVGNIMVGVVLLFGGLRVLHGEMTVGVLAAFLLYLGQFFEPMQNITDFYNTFQAASAALEKLSGVLEERPQVAPPLHPRTPSAVTGRLEFQGVRFAYRDRVVLEALDLTVPAGQTLALVGETGAGKTTLARLATRFYDPLGGAVRLDGVDMRDWDEDLLRAAVVMVTQDGYLFGGTIADNLAFGRPAATRAEVVRAARAVGADRFIDQIAGGYDADVGKHGGRLSAGQRQLLAFARAFLADPRVLILDEATAALDVPSERLVQRALRTVLARRTAIIIAHRLTTVEIADRVIVLDRGRIVEDGSPADLLGGTGRYAALHQAWLASLA